MISVLSIVHDTMVDGPGFRTSIYCAGCPNACPGCHNPQSWDIHHGTMMETEEILREIKKDPFANVTFTGGDPMFQPEGFLALAKAIKAETKKTIWCYSGFVFENLLQNERQKALLQYIDVLVDGPCKCQVVLLFLSFFIVMYRALFLIPCSLHREMRYFRCQNAS